MHKIMLLVATLLFSLPSFSDETKPLAQLAVPEIPLEEQINEPASSSEKKSSRKAAQQEPRIGPYNSKLWWFLIGVTSLWVLYDMSRRRQ